MTSTSTDGSSATGGVVVRIFGGTGVDGPEGPVSIGGPRQRQLLALLALRAGSAATMDWLAEHLWSDDDRPQSPGAAVRTYVSRLRQSLPESARDWILTEPSGYRLDAPVGGLEHQRFGQLRNEATAARGRGDPLVAQELLTEALALWRGEPFLELEELDLARPEIEQLRLDRLEMLEERWESSLALGRHTQITGELAVFTSENRLRDRARQQYALALHRSGRTAEGLRVIADYREYLAENSGLDPSPAMVELEQAMLTGDDALTVEPVGRPLRGYRLLDEIGSGSFSVVWRAMQPSVGREVAIKQIRSDLASQPEFIRRFEAEAHLVARIEHPHIVPLIDYWRDPDSAYLVMRLLRGDTLERRLDDGPMSVTDTLVLAAQIGGALKAAHNHGIIHRDVKTGNILFDETGNAFLADFGIALEAAVSAGPEAALSTGSPAYSAPEQIRREHLGPQADVFSLGVVIFECLTGTLPFQDSKTVEQLLERQLNAPYPPLIEVLPAISPAISAAVATATAKRSLDRWPSIEDFLTALTADPLAASPAALVDKDLPNPYKGLQAFDDADAAHFFGRERLVSEIITRLDGTSVQARSQIVVGPSGSGKSSAVRAGLLPALRSGAASGSSDWFITMMVPGNSPFEALEAALLRVAVNPPDSLLEQLQASDRGVLRSVRRCLSSDDQRVLLFIDQFEEVFTGTPVEDADAFLAGLASAVEDPASPLRLVVTLRADYYHRPLAHSKFARLMKETAIDVTPLAPDELERAIVEPARALGVELEPGLAARISAAALGQTAPLPLLQYVLSELFERRDGAVLTAAAYDEVGGLSGALSARAEAIYGDGNDEERAAIRSLFGRMINPGEDQADLRRRVPLQDFANEAATQSVVERLANARLVTFDRDHSTREPTIEVAHEALLREWPRLVSWLDEDADTLRQVDAIAAAASTWEAGGREPGDLYRGGRLESAADLALTSPERLRKIDVEFVDAARATSEAQRVAEQKGVRRLRRLVVGVGAALVLALIAGGVAFRQQQRADDQADSAVAAQAIAEEQRNLAVDAATDAEAAGQSAEEQRNLAVDAAGEAELATLLSRSAALDTEDSTVATLLALEAYRRTQNVETEQAVFNALTSTASANRVSTFAPLSTSSCPLGHLSSSGLSEYLNVDGVLLHRDLLTGEVSEVGRSSQTCVNWIGDQTLDRRLQWSFDLKTLYFGPYEGPSIAVMTFDVATRLVKSSFRATHVLSFVQFVDGRPTLQLLDDRTGETVADPLQGGQQFIGAADVSLDGSRIAWATHTIDRSAGIGQLAVLDGTTGQVLIEIDMAEAAARVVFDDAADQLVMVLVDGTLQTLDLVTGELIYDVPTELPPRITELDVRADGTIVAVSAGQVALVNRATGRIDGTVDLQSVENSRYRPDGTLLTVTSSDQIEILSLDGNALVEQVWNFPADGGDVSDGFVTGFVADQPLLLDLETGDVAEIDLRYPNGDSFNPELVYRDANGVVAINDGEVGRWRDEQLVESFNFDAEIIGSQRAGNYWLIGSERVDGTLKLDLVNLELNEMGVVYTVEAPAQVIAGSPILDGGAWVLDEDGVLRTYNPTGELIVELQTELAAVVLDGRSDGDYDPASERGVVLYQGNATDPGGIVLLDHATGKVEQIVDGEYGGIGFAANGELLVIVHLDGTVRLWDIAQARSIGIAWQGTDASSGAPVWFDEGADVVWAHVAGEVVKVPVTPERWVEKACEIVGRDFTQDEWDRWVPGDLPLFSACR